MLREQARAQRALRALRAACAAQQAERTVYQFALAHAARCSLRRIFAPWALAGALRRDQLYRRPPSLACNGGECFRLHCGATRRVAQLL